MPALARGKNSDDASVGVDASGAVVDTDTVLPTCADLVTDVGYLATGQTVSRTYGNGMTRHLTWDVQHGRVEQVAAVLPGTGGIAGATVQADMYSYDTAGRMISRPDPDGTGSQSVEWDVLSTLTSAGGETYLYDGEGQRVARMMDGAVTVWVGTDEATATGSLTADVSASRYYRIAGSAVAMRHVGDVDRDGVDDAGVAFTLGDVQGSAQVTVDAELSATGSVEAASGSAERSPSAYTPYGVTRGGHNLVVSRGWLGQVEDTTSATGVTATGLTYLNAGYYDPVLGRFLSPDPLMNPGDRRTLDPYMYAGNHPTTYTDASGLLFCLGSMGSFGAGLIGLSCPASSGHSTANKFGHVAAGVAASGQKKWDSTRSVFTVKGVKQVANDVNTFKSAVTTYWFVKSAVDTAEDVGQDANGIAGHQCYGDNYYLREIREGGGTLALDASLTYASALAGASSYFSALRSAKSAAPELPAPPIAANTAARAGWSVGDDIYSATRAGNSPSWSTVRARSWKNEAANPQYGT